MSDIYQPVNISSEHYARGIIHGRKEAHDAADKELDEVAATLKKTEKALLDEIETSNALREKNKRLENALWQLNGLVLNSAKLADNVPPSGEDVQDAIYRIVAKGHANMVSEHLWKIVSDISVMMTVLDATPTKADKNGKQINLSEYQ